VDSRATSAVVAAGALARGGDLVILMLWSVLPLRQRFHRRGFGHPGVTRRRSHRAGAILGLALTAAGCGGTEDVLLTLTVENKHRYGECVPTQDTKARALQMFLVQSDGHATPHEPCFNVDLYPIVTMEYLRQRGYIARGLSGAGGYKIVVDIYSKPCPPSPAARLLCLVSNWVPPSDGTAQALGVWIRCAAECPSPP
jgi:hypothetical protein